MAFNFVRVLEYNFVLIFHLPHVFSAPPHVRLSLILFHIIIAVEDYSYETSHNAIFAIFILFSFSQGHIICSM
jgi:hypothetical protein